MKKGIKILAALVGIVIIAIVAGLIYVTRHLPDVGPAPDISIQATPEMLERGEYLANHVVACIGCHSTRNFQYFAGPIVAGTEGKGGECFDRSLGFPGEFYSRNITPYGIGRWTDGEL